MTANFKDSVLRIRRQVSLLYVELTRHGIADGTSGSLSARVPGHALMVTTPFGVGGEGLAEARMILCDFAGNAFEDTGAPSPDAMVAGYLFQHRPSVGGVARAGATQLDERASGDFMMGDPSLPRDDASVGRDLVSALDGNLLPAVLMRRHGTFSIGRDARSAVKAAVMCEALDLSARTARQTATPRLPRR